MYTASVFRSQIYAPLLPDRHSSSYGSHFLIRQVYNPFGLLGSLRRAYLGASKIFGNQNLQLALGQSGNLLLHQLLRAGPDRVLSPILELQ